MDSGTLAGAAEASVMILLSYIREAGSGLPVVPPQAVIQMRYSASDLKRY
jgi:hypothetical protein